MKQNEGSWSRKKVLEGLGREEKKAELEQPCVRPWGLVGFGIGEGVVGE